MFFFFDDLWFHIFTKIILIAGKILNDIPYCFFFFLHILLIYDPHINLNTLTFVKQSLIEINFELYICIFTEIFGDWKYLIYGDDLGFTNGRRRKQLQKDTRR